MDRMLSEYTLDEIKLGLHEYADGTLECCICGRLFEAGEIFHIGERFYDHKRAAQMHLNEHGGMFDQLLKLDKKYTGLTEHQANLLRMMRSGMSDAQIAERLGTAASTVRHQRFMFREKAKQAKAYLALFDLSIGSKTPYEDQMVPVHASATMVDDRFQITNKEEEQVCKAYFSAGEPWKLLSFPSKEKKKIVVLRRIVELFDKDTTYSEVDVNLILRNVFDDFATLRRYLIEYGFMSRSRDGKEYRRSDGGIRI